MSTKKFFKGLRWILSAVIAFLVLICSAFALLQTPWAKDQIRQKITHVLNQAGMTFYAEDLSGDPPFSWKLQKAEISLEADQSLTLSEIKLRIAILPLLRGHLVIDYLKVQNTEFVYDSFLDTKQSINLEAIQHLARSHLEKLSLPFSITIHHLALENFNCIEKQSRSLISFGLTAKIMMRKSKKEFAFNVRVLSPDHKTTYAETEFIGSQRKNHIELKSKLNLDNDSAFFSEHLRAAAVLNVSLKGPWASWHQILEQEHQVDSPLTGQVKGIIDKLQIPAWPLLERKWKFKSEFSINSFSELFVQQCIVVSDLLHLKGKGQIFKDLEQSKLILGLFVPDLSLFSSDSEVPINGSVEGKLIYRDQKLKFSFDAEALKIQDFSIAAIQGIIKGKKLSDHWTASANIESKDSDFSFKNIFALDFTPKERISIQDFTITTPQATASGYLTYEIHQNLFNGALFANIQQLDRIASLLKQDYLNGNLAIEVQVQGQDQKQDIRCVAIGKQMIYNELMLDDFTLSAEISDIWDRPQGRFSLLAEKFYSPNLYLSRLNFGTYSDEDNWPFYIDAEGRLESLFQTYAEGFWKKEKSLFTVELTQLFGDLAQTAFSLKYPTELEWGLNYLNLSPFEFRIGEGQFFTRFELSAVRSIAEWQFEHFPLEILSCLKPRFLLKGFVTARGFFDGTQNNMEGAFNASLEEANVLHFGKTEPFQAKGSVQMHLNQKRLQVQSDLYANDGQFFDLTASLPIISCNYPLKLAIDKQAPATAEAVMEGHLEDLFDFVNLGPNHFSGLISARLFLSQTLANPSLQGKLEWSEGTYENYFIGLSLKDIEAKFEAQNDKIRLLHLTAADDRQGKMTAEGKFLLKPQESFPYTLDAELDHLHTLRFDMIDCNFSGPLYLNGNLQNMYAQGNLIIDEALIQINERLPYEVPSLDVTYIHRPSHLYSKERELSNKFTFYMDLELTAEDKVFVEGRGLNAELQGNVRLHGSNTNISALGSLQLIKGEYQFSGKIFKLTEGEILFNDKPNSSAYLNLSGTLSLPNITITAMLHGPLISPQLSFQSNPQRPTSDILSLILFNKDIAEISHTEAIQLASTLMSLSGGAGPDVLESIRKSIGIDRLNIASRQGAKEGSDEIAVEIGKYLTRGIMITLSQSQTSSRIIVEVELPHGFVFQAETQEDEEGKFSLKWTKNY